MRTKLHISRLKKRRQFRRSRISDELRLQSLHLPMKRAQQALRIRAAGAAGGAVGIRAKALHRSNHPGRSYIRKGFAAILAVFSIFVVAAVVKVRSWCQGVEFAAIGFEGGEVDDAREAGVGEGFVGADLYGEIGGCGARGVVGREGGVGWWAVEECGLAIDMAAAEGVFDIGGVAGREGLFIEEMAVSFVLFAAEAENREDLGEEVRRHGRLVGRVEAIVVRIGRGTWDDSSEFGDRKLCGCSKLTPFLGCITPQTSDCEL